MNREIANAMSGDLEILYNMNQKLLQLCGTDASEDFEDNSKRLLDIIQDIPRVVPYSFNNNKKILEYVDRNGLLEYKGEIIYLAEEYDKILDDNYIFLDNVRDIRNKYEHKMHGIQHKVSLSDSVLLFEFLFDVGKDEIIVTSDDLIKLIKSINILFSRIVSDIKKYAIENNLTDYPYYKKINRFDFKDFNELYDSNLINKIGKVMNEFN